jgi:hypothetical protein
VIVGQNGSRLTQETQIAVAGCAAAPTLRILSRRVRGNTVVVRFDASAAGSVTISGKGIKTVRRGVRAGIQTLRVPLTKAGKALKRHHRKISVKVTLSVPEATATASKAVAVKL